MTRLREPGNDPRTLARDIPGLLEGLFPHLVPTVVKNLNRASTKADRCPPLQPEELMGSSLTRAMLFELAVAVAEQFLAGTSEPDWNFALGVALDRQRRHFDARLPSSLVKADMALAVHVARNLVRMLDDLKTAHPGELLVSSPKIPGYQWIASGVGDFSVGTTLVEVKCTGKNFSSADYRQVLIYWLLSYNAALEKDTPEWTEVVLMNPRRGYTLTLFFSDLVELLSSGRAKVELVELFMNIVDERRMRK